MVYSYNGFDAKYITIPRENINAGNLVCMTSAGRVRDAYQNEKFMGVCTNENINGAVVQISGYVEMPYDDDHIFTGYRKLVAGTEGHVTLYNEENDTMHEGAREYLVLTYDSVKKTIGFIL